MLLQSIIATVCLFASLGCTQDLATPKKGESNPEKNNVSESGVENDLYPTEEAHVKPLISKAPYHAQTGIHEFVSSKNGVVAVERSLVLESNGKSSSTLYLRRASDGFSRIYGPLAQGTFVSSPYVYGDSYVIASVFPSLNSIGEIEVPYQLSLVKLTDSDFEAKAIDNSIFRIPAHTPPAEPGGSSPVSPRLGAREYYEKVLLQANRQYSPTVFTENNQFRLLYENAMEIAAYSPHDGSLVEVRPVDFNTFGLKTIRCSGSEQPSFLFVGKKEMFDPLYSEITEGANEEETIFAYFTLLNKFFVTRFVRRGVDAENFIAKVCYRDDANLYVGGETYSVKEKGRSIASIWKFTPNSLEKVTFNLPGNSFVSAITIHADKNLFVGGSCNFSRAQRGSVSHMNGFVSELSSVFEVRWIQKLVGPKTTRVFSLFSEQQADTVRLLVGGLTDGPSTHSGGDHSLSFLHEVKLNQIKRSK